MIVIDEKSIEALKKILIKKNKNVIKIVPMSAG